MTLEVNSPTLHGVLGRILAVKHREVQAARVETPLPALRRAAKAAPPPRGFAARLRQHIATQGCAVIAEIKRASPSKGILRESFDVPAIARSYAQAGAACLSVLTDREFFQGEPHYLNLAREASALPALRKDFLVDAYQVWEARALGADAVLLIAAALQSADLRRFARQAQELGMDVLVEVHERAELDVALSVPDALIGVNNRNLHSFEVSLDTTLAMLPDIPADRLLVTESGIATAADVQRLRSAGVQAFLVGEAFMRAPDPGIALQTLFAA